LIRLAVMIAIAVMTSPAFACSRVGGPPTVAESLASADEVFIAHLVSVKEIVMKGPEREEGPILEGQYRLIEVLKGKPARSGKVHDLPFGPGNCSLGLMVGWDYVFMIKRATEFPRLRWVSMFSGSFPLGPYREAGQSEESELVEVRNILKAQTSVKQTP